MVWLRGRSVLIPLLLQRHFLRNSNVMPDSASSDEPEREDAGLHVTSDPDRTEVEQPDTSGASEVPSLPFRVLLVSDLAPESSPDGVGL